MLKQNGKTQISRTFFLGAYFENYNPDLPYGERIPSWKRMCREINDAYEPGFLVKLDNYVKANGVNKAVVAMQEAWHQIATYKQ